jgi:hypothetical protein
VVVFIFDMPVFFDQFIGLRGIHFVIGNVYGNFTDMHGFPISWEMPHCIVVWMELGEMAGF